jgi:hypothetical protein
MPRKPSDIVQPNLRIREDLRRRLEAAAKKRGVSLNFEMTERLKASFDQGDLDRLSRGRRRHGDCLQTGIHQILGLRAVAGFSCEAIFDPLIHQHMFGRGCGR